MREKRKIKLEKLKINEKSKNKWLQEEDDFSCDSFPGSSTDDEREREREILWSRLTQFGCSLKIPPLSKVKLTTSSKNM